MKKTSLLLLLSMLAASGCGKSGLAAGQISYSGKTLTYGENKVEDVFFTDGVELTLNNANDMMKSKRKLIIHIIRQTAFGFLR